MAHHDHDVALRSPLLAAAAALLVGTLAAVGVARWTGVGPDSASQAPVIAERRLRFADRPDGRVIAIDAADPHTEWVAAAAGEGGFLRGTLRALARERRALGIGAEAPMRLVARADGRISLEDTATARRIDLESFGPTNAAVFARLLGDARADASRP